MSALMEIVNKNNYGRLLNGNQYWVSNTDMPLDEAQKELARLQARVVELEAELGAKEVSDRLLKKGFDIFDGELSLCDEVNSDEWIWRWSVKYYFEETDIPVHSDPDQCPTCDKPCYACIGHDEDPAMLPLFEQADEKGESVG